MDSSTGEVPTVSAMADKREKERAMRSLTSGDVDSPDAEEGDYGCCSWHPRFLQCLNNIRVHVLFQCLFNFFEGFIVNGVINVIIVALETRYRLSSTKSGLIASGNDFGAFPVLLFIGFAIEGRRKPVFMAAGILLMAVGSLFFALPHFIGGPYVYTTTGGAGSDSAAANLCSAGQTTNATCGQGDKAATHDLYPFFLIGQVLLGIGAAPMFTVGLTYIDENSKPKMTSLYTGLIFASAAIGVAAGYVTAGQTLALFVDIDTVDPNSVSLTPADPQWVGAWWIGVLVSLVAFVVICIPFLGYPTHMPGFNKLQKTRHSEVHKNNLKYASKGNQHSPNIKDFFKSFAVLLTNPTFVLLALGSTFDALIISGTATFGAKLLQQFFQVDLTMAGTIMGAITVPGAGGGMLLGGWLVKRWSLRCRGIIRLCMTFTLLSLLLSPSFFAQCPRTSMAGLDGAYPHDGNHSKYADDGHLTSHCNRDCNCDTQGMEPVCYRGSTVFFSPCHAGCTAVSAHNGTKSYINCSCADDVQFSNKKAVVDAEAEVDAELLSGACAGDACPWLYVFCFLFFCIMVFTFATMSPNVTAVMRCVPFNQRSQAVGLQLLTGRVLGTTPGPVLFGAIVDSACSVWQESACSGRGVCWVYDPQSLAVRIMGWWIGLKLCGSLVYGLASCLYQQAEDTEVPGDKYKSDVGL